MKKKDTNKKNQHAHCKPNPNVTQHDYISLREYFLCPDYPQINARKFGVQVWSAVVQVCSMIVFGYQLVGIGN